MKAAVLHDKQSAFELSELPTPSPQAGEVLIRLQAAALNRRDYWIQQGQYAGLRYPIVVGSDGFGTVVAAGEGVDAAAWLGRELLLHPGYDWGADERVQAKSYKIVGLPENGTLAEYISVPVSRVESKPQHLDGIEAAALPLAGLTAYRALCVRAGLRRGEKVLVTGIGGGVALFALQFAVALGAEVFVTSGSDEKIVKAEHLGAAGAANYKQADWVQQLKAKAGGFDVIIDGAGGEGFGGLVDLANPGARIVIYGGTQGTLPALSPQKIFWKQISIMGSTMGSPDDFRAMLELVDKHQLVPVIDTVFGSLSETNQAVERMRGSHQFGKIVIRIGAE